MSRFSSNGPRRFGRSAAAATILSCSLIAVLVPSGAASAQPVVGAPLIEYTRFPGGNWGSANISSPWGLPPALINAIPFTDPVTAYQNLYAASTNNHLIEHTRLLTGKWVAADLTIAANGPAVTNNPAPFVDPITGLQNVYATSTIGHLIEFTRQTVGGWSAVDLTQAFSGPTITADPAPFVDPGTGLQNVYATATNGHLVEYTRVPTRWVVTDVTAASVGPTIFNDPIPFVDPATGLQNVYATTSNGDLAEFTRFLGGNWGSVDITGFYGGPNIVGHPVPFTDPVTHFQNAYTTTSDNHLAEYTRLGDGLWHSVDLTSFYLGSPVPSTPAPYVDPLSGAQIAFATTSASHLVEYERQPAGNWRIIDITASYTGALVPGDPQPFLDATTGLLNVFVTGIGA